MPFFGHNPTGFRDRPLLFIDLEMTGLDPAVHEIIEVAALRVSQPDFAIVNSYYTKVLPTHVATADPAALEVVKYDPKLWADAISLPHMLHELADFAPNCILAGWGVQNEWDFLLAALTNLQLPFFFGNFLLDISTLAFSKLYADQSLTRLGLASVCRHLSIPLDNHQPDSDIRATYEIFKRLQLS